MRAARLIAPRQWEIIEVEKPQPAADQMLVRLERVAICGTDKPQYVGVTKNYPISPGGPGHEGLGVVEACPSGEYEVGERVLLWGFDRGLYQEYVLAPLQGCIRLTQEVASEVVLMSQLLGTVIHCFYKLGHVINKKVVVIGQGSVGQLFNATLRNLGAKQIIGIDPLGYRLEIAGKMGATHVINPEQEDVVERVTEITGGEMADMVVEAVGKEATFNLCARLVKRNGTAVFFGIPNKESAEGIVPLRLSELMGKEVRVIYTVGPNPLEDYTIAYDWIVQGRIDVRPIITHVLPFAEIQKGFAMAFDEPEKSKPIKIVLAFGD